MAAKIIVYGHSAAGRVISARLAIALAASHQAVVIDDLERHHNAITIHCVDHVLPKVSVHRTQVKRGKGIRKKSWERQTFY